MPHHSNDPFGPPARQRRDRFDRPLHGVAPQRVPEPPVEDDPEVQADQNQKALVAPPSLRTANDEIARARARIEREADRREERHRRAILSDFIDVLDDLDRALAAGNGSGVVEGVEMVHRRFLDKLTRHGVRRREVLAGDPFDATAHEAIAAVPTGPDDDGRVVEVLRPAYFVGDELLRPAQVIVGRAT